MQERLRTHRGTDVEALRASLQASSGSPVSLIETHLSWVLLTADLAYKLKKAVRLPFVDCSTVALREHLCTEEVRLNRRLAPALYLGVLPVRGTTDAPAIGGSGEPVDFFVCMRRLVPGSLASEMLASGSLGTAALASELGVPLAIVHCDAPAAVLRSRLLSRAASGADPSEADARVLESQLARLQALAPQEQTRTVWVGANVALNASAVWQTIAQRATQARACWRPSRRHKTLPYPRPGPGST